MTLTKISAGWPGSVTWVVPLAVLVLTVGCSGSDPTDAGEKLCREGAGVAAQISGTPDPIEMCVPNDQTTTTYEAREPTRYEISATFQTDSLTILLEVSFLTHTSLPQSLFVSGTPAALCVDPANACIYYREVKTDTYDFASTTVTGLFTLTFADENIAVATFHDLLIDLEDPSGTPAGTRLISEGFVNVTPGP